MRFVSCNFCQAEDASVKFVLQDFQLGLPGEFRLVQCNRCGLLYLNPRPSWDELVRYYPPSYGSFLQAPSTEGDIGFVRHWFQEYGMRRRCRIVTRFCSKGRLLDVGCGTGSFLSKMRHYGQWQLFGVEPVSAAARVAEEALGFKVFNTELREVGFPEDYFDVLTLWDVLEHVPEPGKTLQEACRILKPGGWLIVQVPDPESWQAHLFGRYWAGYDAPRHLFSYPSSILRAWLLKLGCGVMMSRSLEGGSSTFWKSLNAWWSHKYGKKSELISAIGDNLATRLFLGPLFALLRLLGLGSSMTFVARREEASKETRSDLALVWKAAQKSDH